MRHVSTRERSSPGHLRRRGLRRRRRAAQGRGLRRARAVHAQLGRGRGRLLHRRRRPAGRAQGLRRARHPAAHGQLRGRLPRAGLRALPRRTAAGRTPNPDVACNREIKFGVCFEHADGSARAGSRRVITRAPRSSTGRRDCCAPPIAGKDQTYFLHTVPGELLARTLFPIGGLTKAEVRRIAHERALPVHDKRDSTGICFIGERPFARVPRDATCRPSPAPSRPPRAVALGDASRTDVLHAGPAPGPGARRRAGCGRGALVRGRQGPRHATCWWSSSSTTTRCCCAGTSTPSAAHWIAGRPPAASFACTVKTRYRQPTSPAWSQFAADGSCLVRTETRSGP